MATMGGPDAWSDGPKSQGNQDSGSHCCPFKDLRLGVSAWREELTALQAGGPSQLPPRFALGQGEWGGSVLPDTKTSK